MHRDRDCDFRCLGAVLASGWPARPGHNLLSKKHAGPSLANLTMPVGVFHKEVWIAERILFGPVCRIFPVEFGGAIPPPN